SAVLRIFLDIIGYVRWREAACVEGNATVSPSEVAHQGLPRPAVACKFVHEDYRGASPGLFVMQFDLIVGCQLRHRMLPTLLDETFRQFPLGKTRRRRA